MNTPKVSVRPRASKRPTDSHGVSLAGPPLVPWQSVRVWWLGAGQAGAECTDDETIAALREYRRTGGMYLRVLADPHDFDADGEPRSGEGPNLTDAGPAVAEIDWTGFPAGDGEQARLCERALDGDPLALDACRRAVARAEAMAARPVVVTVAGEEDFAACHPLASLALSRVEMLGAAAAEAGDAATVLICARALGGNLDALHECARLIRGAR